MAKKETELYPPVKAYMEQRGYLVRSEVRDCDLAAVKDGHLVVVEGQSASVFIGTCLVSSIVAATPRTAPCE